ncbi:MAG TPA: helix-turn-helix transcriptional regulator [Opitutaceae bacterium]|nr:helix-turn-helix transcriptional regulator [Opitutaceae bacterium]
MNPDRKTIDREILQPLWKVHVLHHAGQGEVVGNWLLEELREHGYEVSPGTLYPLLARLVRLGWLAPVSGAKRRGRQAYPLRLTAQGRRVLDEVRARLAELNEEVFGDGCAGAADARGKRDDV